MTLRDEPLTAAHPVPPVAVAAAYPQYVELGWEQVDSVTQDLAVTILRDEQ